MYVSVCLSAYTYKMPSCKCAQNVQVDCRWDTVFASLVCVSLAMSTYGFILSLFRESWPKNDQMAALLFWTHLCWLFCVILFLSIYVYVCRRTSFIDVDFHSLACNMHNDPSHVLMFLSNLRFRGTRALFPSMATHRAWGTDIRRHWYFMLYEPMYMKTLRVAERHITTHFHCSVYSQPLNSLRKSYVMSETTTNNVHSNATNPLSRLEDCVDTSRYQSGKFASFTMWL